MTESHPGDTHEIQLAAPKGARSEGLGSFPGCDPYRSGDSPARIGAHERLADTVSALGEPAFARIHVRRLGLDDIETSTDTVDMGRDSR